MKKKDLFAYLDAWEFSELGEISIAIMEYFRDFVEKDPDYQPSY